MGNNTNRPGPTCGGARPPEGDVVQAAKNADWQQVVLNGGPPCFFLEDGRRFCLRAQRWSGHTDKDEWPEHRFVSLADLLERADHDQP